MAGGWCSLSRPPQPKAANTVASPRTSGTLADVRNALPTDGGRCCWYRLGAGPGRPVTAVVVALVAEAAAGAPAGAGAAVAGAEPGCAAPGISAPQADAALVAAA